MVIEQHGPEVRDRQVQLADSFFNLPGRGMAAYQPRRRFEGKPRGEQPVHHDVVHRPR
jgi:hypothetical protein